MATKKTSVKTQSNDTPLPNVMVVGMEGAPLDAVFQKLRGEAPMFKQKDKRVRACKGVIAKSPCKIHVFQGMRSEHTMTQEEQIALWNENNDVFGLLLERLPSARVLVQVVNAYAEDPEAEAAEFDHCIYGGWHDEHADVELLFVHDGRPVDASKKQQFWKAYPHARAFSVEDKEQVSALKKRIGGYLRETKTPYELPTDASGFRLERFDLQALQLELLRRTCFGGFDGALVYGSLIALDGVLSVIPTRMMETKYKGNEVAERKTNGLKHLAALQHNQWLANELQVKMDSKKGALRVKKLALEAWGAASATLKEDHIVVAKWKAKRRPTMQDLQLELIRRGSFNAFRGDRVYSWLVENRSSWLAVLFGRHIQRLDSEQGWTKDYAALNAVKELPNGYWNADNLWIIAPSEQASELIARVGRLHWYADSLVVFSPEDAKKAAGIEPPQQLLEFWWD